MRSSLRHPLRLHYILLGSLLLLATQRIDLRPFRLGRHGAASLDAPDGRTSVGNEFLRVLHGCKLLQLRVVPFHPRLDGLHVAILDQFVEPLLHTFHFLEQLVNSCMYRVVYGTSSRLPR